MLSKSSKNLKRNNSSPTQTMSASSGQKSRRMSIDSSESGSKTVPYHRPPDFSARTLPASQKALDDITVFCDFVAMELKAILSNSVVFRNTKRDIIEVIYKAQKEILNKLDNSKIKCSSNSGKENIKKHSSASGSDISKNIASTGTNKRKDAPSHSSSKSDSSSKLHTETSSSSSNANCLKICADNSLKSSSKSTLKESSKNSSKKSIKGSPKKSLKKSNVYTPTSPIADPKVQTTLSAVNCPTPSYPPSVHDGFGRTPEYFYESTCNETEIDSPQTNGDVEQKIAENGNLEMEKFQEVLDPLMEKNILFVCSYCSKYTEFCHFCSQCVPNLAICGMCEKTVLHPHLLTLKGLGLDKGFFQINIEKNLRLEEAERVFALRFLQSVCHTRVCKGNRFCQQLGCHQMKEQLEHFYECRLPQCNNCTRLKILCCNNNLMMANFCPGPFCKSESRSVVKSMNEAPLLNATYFSHIRENIQSRLAALQVLLVCCVCKCALTLPSYVCMYAHIVCGACVAVQSDKSGCILCQSSTDKAFTMAVNVLTSVKPF